MEAHDQLNWEFTCSSCTAALSYSGNYPQCCQCGKIFKINKGILSCAAADAHHWGWVPAERFEEVYDTAQQHGWRQGLDHAAKIRNKDKSAFYSYMTGKQRSLFSRITDCSRESVVLDIGSGWGPISIDFAKIAKRVYSLDTTLDNLRFLELRAKQEGINNLVPIHADLTSDEYLPFPADHLDLAIMNGVLEWVPEGCDDSDPVDIQIKTLRKVHRCLKRGGHLYIAIENRFGAHYFMGRPDEHTGLRFVTLLPRFVARMYSKIKRKRDYRCYTHSRSKLETLLRTAGFGDVTTYAILPHYRFPQYIVPLDDGEAWRFLYSSYLEQKLNPFIRIFGRMGLALGIHRHVVPAFAVLAKK